MGNLSCGNLDPPPSSGGQAAASSPSALHEDGLTKRFRRCRSPFREPPKSDRHPLGTLIAIARNTHLRCFSQSPSKLFYFALRLIANLGNVICILPPQTFQFRSLVVLQCLYLGVKRRVTSWVLDVAHDGIYANSPHKDRNNHSDSNEDKVVTMPFPLQ